jgi:hypothetical protein
MAFLRLPISPGLNQPVMFMDHREIMFAGLHLRL